MGTELEIIPQIKRSANTSDGLMLKYLRAYNNSIGIVEMIFTALRAFWLPLALRASGVSGNKLRDVAITSIGQLEAQINLIKRLCGASGLLQPAMSLDNLAVTPKSENKISMQPAASVVTPTRVNKSDSPLEAVGEEFEYHRTKLVGDNNEKEKYETVVVN